MGESKHFGLIGGLGVGATVIYYEGIAAACAAKAVVPRITIAHANAPTALAHVQAGRIDGLAAYLAGFVQELAAAGASFAAIPAITPHICRAKLKALVKLPLIDILDMTGDHVAQRGIKRIALFGTRYTIESRLFGALEGIAIVDPQPPEIDEIHRIYLELAQKGACTTEDADRLREIAHTLIRRDGIEAVLLAGTDLNLIFDERTAGFPAIDCAKAHIDAIVACMTAMEHA